MKVKIVLVLLISCVISPVFSQDNLSNESKNVQLKVIIDTDISLVGSLTFSESDTAYYKDGKIQSISTYPSTRNKMLINSIYGYVLQKKVFQYDKCGSLRNITEISRYTGPIQSCHDYYFNNPYEIKQNILENVDCDKLWIRPLVFY